jgi:hypothetical protein
MSIKFGLLGYMLEVVVRVRIYLFILISFTGIDCITGVRGTENMQH